MTDKQITLDNIKNIRTRLDDIEKIFNEPIETKYLLILINDDIHHIFDSLLAIDKEVDFFNGICKDYSCYRVEVIKKRMGGTK